MFDQLFSQSGFSYDRCRSFLAIIDAGGITQAALGSTSRQSQLSRQLGELEAWMGTKLLTRGRGRFGLTETGKQLAVLLNGHFMGLERLKASVHGTKQIVRLGAGESLLQWLVMPALSNSRLALPMERWHLDNLRSEEILSGLQDGALDFGILRGKRIPKGLASKPIGTMKYVLFVPNGLLADMESREDDASFPFATLEGDTHLGKVLEAQTAIRPSRMDSHVSCTSLAQIAEAVRLGIAAAILPVIVRKFGVGESSTEFELSKSTDVALSLAWNPVSIRSMSDFPKWKSWLLSRLTLELES